MPAVPPVQDGRNLEVNFLRVKWRTGGLTSARMPTSRFAALQPHTSQPSRLVRSNRPCRKLRCQGSSCSDLESFWRTSKCAAGQLRVEALREETMEGAGNLLCRAFAGTPEGRPIKIVMDGLEVALTEFAKEHKGTRGGVFLVGILEDTQQVVGTAAISFFDATREELAPEPPQDSAYLSNVAVLDKLRGKGIGKVMVRAAEEAVVHFSDRRKLYLHVRDNNQEAVGMYLSEGYMEIETYAPLPRWISNRPAMVLMAKSL